MKRLLIFVGALAWFSLGPDTANAQSVSVTISTPSSTVTVGMPVFIDVTLTNLSQAGVDWQKPGDYLFVVNDANGNPVNFTASGQHLDAFGNPHSTRFIYLQAGKSDVQRLAISNLYDLTQPGRYTLQVVASRLGQMTSNLLTLTVNAGPRGDLNGDGIVDLNDLALIQSALNTAANRDPGTGNVNDARDLNGDGVINIQDARILQTLCTYPRCASHP